MTPDFLYNYRWAEILNKDPDTQIAMLEARDRELEQYFLFGGRCPLELPFRWSQIMPGVAAGEQWAIQALEENDRAVEAMFGECNCGSGFTLTFERAELSIYECYGQWDGAAAAGFTTLTLESIEMNLTFAENDVAFIDLGFEDLTHGSFTNYGEGNYDPTFPYTSPSRTDIRNYGGHVNLTQADIGPRGGLRDISDPFYHPMSYFASYPYLDLASGPVTITVDPYTTFYADVLPDTGHIPPYDTYPDNENPALVGWSGTIAFHFAEAGSNIAIPLT